MIVPGTEVDGRYRVVRLLGEGSMGAVYEAEHVAVGRKVALKVLHARFAQVPDAVRRFAREARAAAAIGHENIVAVLDAGTHGDEPYLVMDLLRGATLGEHLARAEVFEPRAACGVIGQVLSALAAAHAKGIVHRDLKPDNVFLVARDGATTVKLIDFGVSKFRPFEEGIHQTTQEGLPIGTPAYMAPEQWMGRRDIDHRADVFAAGVMLYEMLTGGMPYEGASQGELFLEIVRGTEEPPPPSEIAPGVPEAIDAVVLRALRRDREARYESAREFLEALRPFGAEGIAVVDAPPASPPDGGPVVLAHRATRRATTVIDRHPRLGRLGVAALAVALVALGAVSALAVRAREAPTTPARSPRAVALAVAPSPASPPPVAEARIPDAAPPTPASAAPPRARRRHRPRAGRAPAPARTGVGSLNISHDF